MYAGFAEENVSAVLQRWAPSNGKHCLPIVYVVQMSYILPN